jgi:hypothetical protein
MSDAITLIEQTLLTSGMETAGANNEADEYLAGEEEAAITQEEELLMSGESTSEEEEKMEQQMLTVALVNSVVETSGHQSPTKTEPEKPEQRYSLRKRRRSGVPQEGAQSSQSAPTRSIIPRRAVKTEAVPACTAIASAPLPVPLAVTSPNKASSLPLALQPPVRRHAPPLPPTKTTKPAATRHAGAKLTKGKAKRLTPPARVLVSSKPLNPSPSPMGVPNPLSNPLPLSNTLPSNGPSVRPPSPSLGAPPAAHTFTEVSNLTVPCPLPPSSFAVEVQQSIAHGIKSEPETMPEKKKVTIAPDLPPSRGRIFSIDLDRKCASKASKAWEK